MTRIVHYPVPSHNPKIVQPARSQLVGGLFVEAVTATNAQAELAPGTGTANNATIKIEPSSTDATGAGTANNPTSKVAPSPATATGTGTANNATINTTGGTNAPAGLASGTGEAFFDGSGGSISLDLIQDNPIDATGTAYTTTSKIAPTPTIATGDGTAFNPTVQTGSFTNAQAGLASGTGTANNTTGKVAPVVGVATGTGTANNPDPSVKATAGIGTGTGTANNPTVTRAGNPQAGVATGVGTANGPALAVLVHAEAASALGVALDATFHVGLIGGTFMIVDRDVVTLGVADRAIASLTVADRSTPTLVEADR